MDKFTIAALTLVITLPIILIASPLFWVWVLFA